MASLSPLMLGPASYEIDEDDYTAVARLQARRPTADVWLERAGQPTAYQMRGA